MKITTLDYIYYCNTYHLLLSYSQMLQLTAPESAQERIQSSYQKYFANILHNITVQKFSKLYANHCFTVKRRHLN